MSREAERKREKKEYLEQLLECIPLLREFLELAVAEKRKERDEEEEWSMHQGQYELDWYDANYKQDFLDEWG